MHKMAKSMSQGYLQEIKQCYAIFCKSHFFSLPPASASSPPSVSLWRRGRPSHPTPQHARAVRADRIGGVSFW